MSDRFKTWASAERGFIQQEIKWLNAGGKFLSPSGDDITPMKLAELASRLEHVHMIIEEFNDTDVS